MSRQRPHMAARLAERIVVEHPGRLSPIAIRLMKGPLATVFRWLFRPRLEGLENVPENRAVLVVANHSGGGGIEIMGLALAWHTHFDYQRPISGMAHPAAWYLPGPAQTVQGLGAVPSTYEAGQKVLEAGLPLIIFPGGDFDAFRPVWQANKVDFNGRKGFLKLARRAWVPIVPLGIRGSHYTAPMLWRSRLLAWLLVIPKVFGLKRFPLSLLGAVGAALIMGLLGPVIGYGWAVLASVLWICSPIAVFLPILPWPIEARLGPAIEPEVLFGDKGDDGPLDESYEKVVGEIQGLVVAP